MATFAVSAQISVPPSVPNAVTFIYDANNRVVQIIDTNNELAFTAYYANPSDVFPATYQVYPSREGSTVHSPTPDDIGLMSKAMAAEVQPKFVPSNWLRLALYGRPTPVTQQECTDDADKFAAFSGVVCSVLAIRNPFVGGACGVLAFELFWDFRFNYCPTIQPYRMTWCDQEALSEHQSGPLPEAAHCNPDPITIFTQQCAQEFNMGIGSVQYTPNGYSMYGTCVIPRGDYEYAGVDKWAICTTHPLWALRLVDGDPGQICAIAH